MATRPMMLPTLTTRPWPRWRIAGRNARVTATRPQGWQVDGDHLGTATGLRVRHVPAALRVVA